jgi:predicted DNA-binding transcriptional regulator AlpA
MPAKTIVGVQILMQAFDVSERTIRRMVDRYELPPPFKLAGKSVWIVDRVHSWLNEAAELQEKKARVHLAKVREFDS